jgi:FkbM family methyltransferase
MNLVLPRGRHGPNVRKVPEAGVSRNRLLHALANPLRAAQKLIELSLTERKRRAVTELTAILRVPAVAVVDIGAADGFHRRWELLGEIARVYLFEPDAKGFQRLRELYANDSRVTCFDTALSETAADVTLTVTAWPRASTCLPQDREFIEQIFLRDHFRPVATLNVPARTLAEVLAGHEIDFIKADVEGFELPILRGAGNDVVSGCMGFELEVIYGKAVHLQPNRFADVDQFCRAQGFELIAMSRPGYWHYALPTAGLESRGFVANGDALYMRLPDAVVGRVQRGIWSVDKLKAAAILYVLYGNFELAYVLVERAKAGGLLSHDIAHECIRALERLAGSGRFLRYNRLRELARRIPGGDDVEDSLDY